MRQASDERDQLEELVQQIIERLTEQGYVSDGRPAGAAATRRPGRRRTEARSTRSKSPTRRSIFSAIARCAICSGSMGRSSAGRHDTRELATGIEAGGPPRPYEFGDTMNLDASATVLSAVQRRRDADAAEARRLASRRTQAGSTSTYEDLMITQGDYQSSCATVCCSTAATAWCSTARIGSRRPSAWRWRCRT